MSSSRTSFRSTGSLKIPRHRALRAQRIRPGVRARTEDRVDRVEPEAPAEPRAPIRPQRSSAPPGDLFSWASGRQEVRTSRDRKRLRIPSQAFGPSFRYGRSQPWVRKRFKEFFQFMDAPRLEIRGDEDLIARTRTRFILGLTALAIYTAWQLMF